MKNILVPTDFSTCANDATGAAVRLAKRFGAAVHLFTNIDLPDNWENMTETERAEDLAAQQLIRQVEMLQAEMMKKHGDATIKAVWSGGSFLKQTAAYVRENGIDLVVMGSHGICGKSEFFIGSNTQKVVRTVHCPVLVIKEPLSKIDFEKVVFASGFSKEDMPAFLKFKEFIKHFVPELHLVAVQASPFDAPYPVKMVDMKPFEEASAPLKCKLHVYQDLSVDSGVRSFAEKTGASLIAISNHQRHPLKRMLVGSNVEALVNHASLPVLTIDFE